MAVVIPAACLLSMKEEYVLIAGIFNCILASLLRLSLSVLLTIRNDSRKEKELIMQYCFIVLRAILMRIFSSLQIAFYSVL